MKEDKTKYVCALLVDDDPNVLAITNLQLTRLGYFVMAFTDVAEAWDVFLNNSSMFSIAITDQEMPCMKGTELARKIASVRPDLPVILYTGSSVEEEALRRSNVRKLVTKPLRNAAGWDEVVATLLG